MTCMRIDLDDVTVFACGRGLRCRCDGRASRRCEFPLRGRRAGEDCGAPLCDRCAVRVGTPVGELDFCGPHARSLRSEAP